MRATWYEVCVEAIENTRRPFSIAEVWNRLGGGPSLYGLMRLAVYDMVAHGLVRCVRSSVNRTATSGRRCLEWEVVR
jgi:hypothetical protein